MNDWGDGCPLQTLFLYKCVSAQAQYEPVHPYRTHIRVSGTAVSRTRGSRARVGCAVQFLCTSDKPRKLTLCLLSDLMRISPISPRFPPRNSYTGYGCWPPCLQARGGGRGQRLCWGQGTLLEQVREYGSSSPAHSACACLNREYGPLRAGAMPPPNLSHPPSISSMRSPR